MGSGSGCSTDGCTVNASRCSLTEDEIVGRSLGGLDTDHGST